MTTRPMLTQREAAAACGVSRTTIRRRREAGDLPNAVQDPARGWLIPVGDLLAAGFRLNAPAPAEDADTPRSTAEDQGGGLDQAAPSVGVEAELERMRHEHALALAQAEYARQLAQAEAEHLRKQLAAKGEHIQDLQRTLAALMPAPERPAISQPAPAAVPGQTHIERQPEQERQPKQEPGERRRWWYRT